MKKKLSLEVDGMKIECNPASTISVKRKVFKFKESKISNMGKLVNQIDLARVRYFGPEYDVKCSIERNGFNGNYRVILE